MAERRGRSSGRFLLLGLLAALLVVAGGCRLEPAGSPAQPGGGEESLLVGRSLQLYDQILQSPGDPFEGLLRPDTELVEGTELLSLGDRPSRQALEATRLWLRRHPRSGGARVVVPFDPETPGSLGIVELPLRGGYLYFGWDAAGHLAKLYMSATAIDWRALGQEAPWPSARRLSLTWSSASARAASSSRSSTLS
ncbi:MAG: hypothetical protein QJR08_02340 [Bacillota bacterium]|nr:hypothetical protein [Bacillota bacterium]